MATTTFYEIGEFEQDLREFAEENSALEVTIEPGEEEGSFVLSAPTVWKLFKFACEWETKHSFCSIDEEEILELIVNGNSPE